MTPTNQTNSPSWRDDLDLVRRVLAGEATALEEFIQRMACVPMILAQRNARNHKALQDDDLADLGQEVLTAIWQRLASYRGQAALESWVFPFCVNHYANAARKQQRRPFHHDLSEPLDLVDSVASPESTLAMSELIYRHLDRLEESQASVIRARHFESLTFEQIAERFGLPIATAKTHYRRGLDLLRVHLGPHLTENLT